MNENCADCEGELEAIQAAAEIWNNTGATFRFQYKGPSTGTEPNQNGRSELLWGRPSDGTLAVTHYLWYSIEDGWVKEYDVVFVSTDPNYSWSTEDAPSDVGRPDVESVACHEFGHWLCLRDLYGEQGYDEDKMMYGRETPHGWHKSGDGPWQPVFAVHRRLHPDDVGGIHYVFPPTAPPSPPTEIEYPPSSDGKHEITWGSSAQASSYELERSDDGGKTWVWVYAGPHTYFDERIVPGPHRYRASATNTAGSSEWQTGTWDCLASLGDANDPILIYAPAQLGWINTRNDLWNRHFRLTADIDLSGFDGKDDRPAFYPIGNPSGTNAEPFTGVFHGNGHVISHLTCGSERYGYCGLFGYVGRTDVIESLRITDANVTGGELVGGLAGCSEGTISACGLSGTVAGSRIHRRAGGAGERIERRA